MILRRIVDAIKRQDWFVVFIELMIVIFGVYIGIYLGDIQEERKFRAETNQALQALESELRSDLERLDEVIAVQTKLVESQALVIDLLGRENLDLERIGDLLIFITDENDTLFPNTSAYRAMQTGGFLAALPDDALRLQITRLVEREYVRQDVNATWYDQQGFELGMSIITFHWDQKNKTLLTGEPESIAVIRNGVMLFHDQGEFYLEFITQSIRPELVKTLAMIDAYQGETE